MDEALIAAVYRRTALYDKSCDNHSNRRYITKQWTDIAQELGQEVEAVRKRWTRLRDYFQRNHKQLITFKFGSAAGKSRKWFHYDAMSFLIPFLADRPITSKVEDPDNSFAENVSIGSPSAASVASDANTSENMGTQDSDETPSLESQDPLPALRGERKRKFSQLRMQPASSFDVDFGAGVLHSRAERPLDEDEMYCLNLVPKMKILDTVSKLECQTEINNVLIRYIKRTKSRSFIEANHENVTTLPSSITAVTHTPDRPTYFTNGPPYSQFGYPQ